MGMQIKVASGVKNEKMLRGGGREKCLRENKMKPGGIGPPGGQPLMIAPYFHV